MTSRQAQWNRRRDLEGLRMLVPEGSPVTVEDENAVCRREWVIRVAGERVYRACRFQAASAWLQGYAVCWRERP